MFPSIPDYKIGDVIAYEPFGGGERIVVVTGREEHNGQPAFDGYLRDEHDFTVWGYDDQITRVVSRQRHAVIAGLGHDRLDTIRRYLPSNYTADSDGGSIYIHGHDSAGWTLDGYVIPRLASGLYFAKEV